MVIQTSSLTATQILALRLWPQRRDDCAPPRFPAGPRATPGWDRGAGATANIIMSCKEAMREAQIRLHPSICQSKDLPEALAQSKIGLWSTKTGLQRRELQEANGTPELETPNTSYCRP